MSCDPAPGDIPGPDLREALVAAFVAAPGASNGGEHDTHPTIGQRTEVLAPSSPQLGKR